MESSKVACLYVASAKFNCYFSSWGKPTGLTRAGLSVNNSGILKFGISRFDDPMRRVECHRISRDTVLGMPIRNMALVCYRSHGTERAARDEEYEIKSFLKSTLEYCDPFTKRPDKFCIPRFKIHGYVESPSGEWLLHHCCGLCAEQEFFEALRHLSLGEPEQWLWTNKTVLDCINITKRHGHRGRRAASCKVTAMIVRAAIMRDGGVWSVPKPGRHNHVLDKMRTLGLERRVYPALPDTQGFLTDTGVFLDRKQALRHAVISGEVPGEWETTHTELFSEDLW